ncbi:citrate lyase acyl carrier protein [Ruoffia tabacinasalis]|uniref:Citrate lyase acyl carrier protein n=1 Tax=Ruoffia tabacinasalis TaxID=87458 RepID=A0A5R9EMZ7_9LACT|nr:citrate lyase acyl carrier protein [Ruoffia tabacinasalis]MBG9977185.1 citrate lyase acyl carrier protein [Ruoffia tabacinasalis]TLQ48984.1 citrate lyase acyl carrier protein [Ruoffia tabacinasalis]HJG47993.1 citrate lyase acyl carrier protein [Ruoffia tabacinasalis]
MEIKQNGVAGTVESSDIMVTVAQSDNGIEIELESSVEKQFGAQIRKVIKETLEKLGVENAKVTAVDQGALDCTVQARTIAAVYRAADETTFNWKEIATWSV